MAGFYRFAAGGSSDEGGERFKNHLFGGSREGLNFFIATLELCLWQPYLMPQLRWLRLFCGANPVTEEKTMYNANLIVNANSVHNPVIQFPSSIFARASRPPPAAHQS